MGQCLIGWFLRPSLCMQHVACGCYCCERLDILGCEKRRLTLRVGVGPLATCQQVLLEKTLEKFEGTPPHPNKPEGGPRRRTLLQEPFQSFSLKAGGRLEADIHGA